MGNVDGEIQGMTEKPLTVELELQVVVACPFTEPELEQALWAVLGATQSHPNPPSGSSAMLSVRVTDDREIQQLNRLYRGEDEVTDVLSFGNDVDEVGTGALPGEKGILGDLVLSWPYIRRYAAKVGTNPRDEFMLCFIHGVLHLLGWDHDDAPRERAMFQLQDSVAQGLGYRPKPTGTR